MARMMRLAALAMMVTLVFSFASRGALSSGHDSPKYKVVEYYVHESFGSENATVVSIAGPNNNLTRGNFGHTSAYDNPIKVGGTQDSEIIGFSTGIATTSRHPFLFHMVFTHTLNSSVLGVGTLEFAGTISLNFPPVLSPVVVTGGTGDFSFYRGVAVIDIVYFGFPFNTYKFTSTITKM